VPAAEREVAPCIRSTLKKHLRGKKSGPERGFFLGGIRAVKKINLPRSEKTFGKWTFLSKMTEIFAKRRLKEEKAPRLRQNLGSNVYQRKPSRKRLSEHKISKGETSCPKGKCS